jgi:hypothetical protein
MQQNVMRRILSRAGEPGLDRRVGRWRGAAVCQIVSRMPVCFRIYYYQAHHSVFRMCITLTQLDITVDPASLLSVLLSFVSRTLPAFEAITYL